MTFIERAGLSFRRRLGSGFVDRVSDVLGVDEQWDAGAARVHLNPFRGPKATLASTDVTIEFNKTPLNFAIACIDPRTQLVVMIKRQQRLII